ncbi:MAG TPA: DMT family transporter [Halanaerobiales bacterium]|nr:DMT family transporter [Halanaerobiales bacterium]
MFGHSLLYLLLAALAGLSMAVQGSLNSVLGKKLGIIEASFIVHLIAAAILFIFLLFNLGKGNSASFFKGPWYLYLGGLLAVIISYTVIISIPELGVAVATTAIISAQVLTAAVIDHFGWLGLEKIQFTWLKVLGIIFLAAGVRLLLSK